MSQKSLRLSVDDEGSPCAEINPKKNIRASKRKVSKLIVGAAVSSNTRVGCNRGLLAALIILAFVTAHTSASADSRPGRWIAS